MESRRIPGAKPVYFSMDRPTETSRYNFTWPANLGMRPAILQPSSIYRSNTLQGSFNRSVVHTPGLKRPTSEISQPAGGKKPCTSARKTPRQEYLDEIFTKLALDKAEKQASKRLVDNTLKTLLRGVTLLENGDQLYCQQFTNAGSYPVRTKIGKADEFDVNIRLNIDCESVRLIGKVRYSYVDEDSSKTQNFFIVRRLRYEPVGISIPAGYAVVDVRMDSCFPLDRFRRMTYRRNVPTSFLHKHLESPIRPLSYVRPRSMLMYRASGSRCIYDHLFNSIVSSQRSSNRSETSPGCIELIPWDVKQHLFQKIIFRSVWNRDIHVSHNSHGPALKITIVPGGRTGIAHHISVDITPSLQCDISLSKFGWPREETRKAFKHVDINEVLQAGTHLVPKKDLFWAISFSKAEKTLLKCIDRDRGCRKYVTKLLKKFVQTCSSQSQNGLPGISSHVIKTQVLWSCEQHSSDPNYWHWDNRDACLINTMKELEDALKSRRLNEYFNPVLNILEGKEVSVLDKLAGFILFKRLYLVMN